MVVGAFICPAAERPNYIPGQMRFAHGVAEAVAKTVKRGPGAGGSGLLQEPGEPLLERVADDIRARLQTREEGDGRSMSIHSGLEVLRTWIEATLIDPTVRFGDG